jgi:hypothetical protein
MHEYMTLYGLILRLFQEFINIVHNSIIQKYLPKRVTAPTTLYLYPSMVIIYFYTSSCQY